MQQHNFNPYYLQALGHYPCIARRLARKVYRIDPDLWSQKARLSIL